MNKKLSKEERKQLIKIKKNQPEPIREITCEDLKLLREHFK